MKLFKLKGISKKYALRAAHYRRAAKGQAMTGAMAGTLLLMKMRCHLMKMRCHCQYIFPTRCFIGEIMIWKKFCYWLYVKSGLRKRDEDNWWKGACHAHSVYGLDAKIVWTMKMRPEWSLEEARERVTNPKW